MILAARGEVEAAQEALATSGSTELSLARHVVQDDRTRREDDSRAAQYWRATAKEWKTASARALVKWLERLIMNDIVRNQRSARTDPMV